jgi:hypothetical protein
VLLRDVSCHLSLESDNPFVMKPSRVDTASEIFNAVCSNESSNQSIKSCGTVQYTMVHTLHSPRYCTLDPAKRRK